MWGWWVTWVGWFWRWVVVRVMMVEVVCKKEGWIGLDLLVVAVGFPIDCWLLVVMVMVHSSPTPFHHHSPSIHSNTLHT